MYHNNFHLKAWFIDEQQQTSTDDKLKQKIGLSQMVQLMCTCTLAVTTVCT